MTLTQFERQDLSDFRFGYLPQDAVAAAWWYVPSALMALYAACVAQVARIFLAGQTSER